MFHSAEVFPQKAQDQLLSEWILHHGHTILQIKPNTARINIPHPH